MAMVDGRPIFCRGLRKRKPQLPNRGRRISNVGEVVEIARVLDAVRKESRHAQTTYIEASGTIDLVAQVDGRQWRLLCILGIRSTQKGCRRGKAQHIGRPVVTLETTESKGSLEACVPSPDLVIYTGRQPGHG